MNDELDALLKEVRTDEYGDSGNYNNEKLKTAIREYAEEREAKLLKSLSPATLHELGLSYGDHTEVVMKSDIDLALACLKEKQ